MAATGRDRQEQSWWLFVYFTESVISIEQTKEIEMKKFLVHIIVVLTLAVALSATWIALAMPRLNTSHAASFGAAKNHVNQVDNANASSSGN